MVAIKVVAIKWLFGDLSGQNTRVNWIDRYRFSLQTNGGINQSVFTIWCSNAPQEAK